MQTLRTTINPTEEITVDDREAVDLEAMGLVLTGTRATTDDGLTKAALRQVTGETGDTAPTPAPKKRAPRKRASRAKSATTESPTTETPDTTTSTTAAGEPADGTTDGGDAENKEG